MEERSDFEREFMQKIMDELGTPQTPEETAAMLEMFRMIRAPVISLDIGAGQKKKTEPKIDLEKIGEG